MLKKLLGWPATLFFYYLGNLISEILNLYDKLFESKMRWAASDDTDDNLWAILSYKMYRIYNRLMHYSVIINDWAGINWWKNK